MTIAVVFDVDGVLVDSPHQRAWQEALQMLVAGEWAGTIGAGGGAPIDLDLPLYQEKVAGKPRLDGARAVLRHFDIPDADRRALRYAEEKQRRLETLIEAGACRPFPDALRLVMRLRDENVRLAAASSSRNANRIMQMVPMPAGSDGAAVDGRFTLLECFDVNVCGFPVERGKPSPDLFLLAASELAVDPGDCIVVEDAPAGVTAAKSGGMKAIGIARLDDRAGLDASGADLVVDSLDEVALDWLLAGAPPARQVGA